MRARESLPTTPLANASSISPNPRCLEESIGAEELAAPRRVVNPATGGQVVGEGGGIFRDFGKAGPNISSSRRACM
jgi:hypothetical protein